MKDAASNGLIFLWLLWIALMTACGDSKSEPEPVTAQEIATHIRFLSGDLSGGKVAGGPGITPADLYVEEFFRNFGLEPVFGSSYRQAFALKGTQPDRDAVLEIFSDKVKIVPLPFEDFVVITERRDYPEVVSGELVYCGSSIRPYRKDEDDKMGFNLKRKILLVEMGGPGNVSDEAVDGEETTAFERWTVYFEEAARAGAAGVFIIHGAGGAEYDWKILRDSWSRERFSFPDSGGNLNFQGWLNEDAVERIFDTVRLDHKYLRAESRNPGFMPLPLGLWARVRQSPAFRSLSVKNVAGMIRGKDKEAENRTIVVSAPCGFPEKNEGLIDNSLATASLLALAAYYAQRPEDRKTHLIFAGLTAKERGLLGADYFVDNLPVPASSVLADIHLEMSGDFGRIGEVFAVGAKHSNLDDICRRSAEETGLRYVLERNTGYGFFFPSGQLSFARAGIPAVCLCRGLVSGEEGGRHYDDALQIIRWAQEIIQRLENSVDPPRFRPESSF